MKWKGRKSSSNVEDRRGMSGGMIGGGIGGVGLIIYLIFTLLGGDPSILTGNTPNQQNNTYTGTTEEQEVADFVSVVLADTEVVWNEVFNEYGMDYEEPTLVLFTNSVQSACGVAGSSTGPFYCPGDQSLYIDLSFYDELSEKFQAPGDFAMAYVVAHEVGHHVQYLLGTSKQVQDLRGKVAETEYNRYLKRLELQADYYAGVWAHYVQDMDYLEEGDIEEALNAASAVGDDRIQEAAQGYVVPDSFTHGTSDQRIRWFYKGFEAGDLENGDTFKLSENEL
ncbi:neutral zinc metallopeptidase [Jeotgalibaca porci]|jgi:predicted metalloprotease|uniref:Metalloprotease n=2 Tax=Jeotgalibaca porci TaxID=1868793 RepID=A0A6G7WHF6_9LACT|nr:neutral zinc metallopeptidase [Jeotgalibaca porci]NLB98796.1 metalloprotease [Lactobacillales bacterium]QIK51680.1 metalloprotease [Jeotgalibaca porci]